jgi:hypothetical protein
MAVPKASVHEDDLLARREDNVRMTGQVWPMKTKPIAEGMK